MTTRAGSTIAFLCMLAGLALADAPTTMNYQGILTDGGAPVANGNYSVEFTIYDAAVGGNSKWSSTQNVTTVNGLFTVVLGKILAIEDTVFNGSVRWLGVKVEADPEMTPRTELTSVPYAARIATVDGASGGAITGETSVSGTAIGNQLSVTNNGLGRGIFSQISNVGNTSPAIQGTHIGVGPGGSFFSDGGGPGIVASATAGYAGDFQGWIKVDGVADIIDGLDSVIQMDATSNILRNWGSDGNGENYRLWGNNFGQMYLHDTDPANNRMVELSGPTSGGELELHSSGGFDFIKLDAGEVFDDAVQLPIGSIVAGEILDEAGVASHKTGATALGASATILSRSIGAPAPGYVLAIGSGIIDAAPHLAVIEQTNLWVTDEQFVSAGKPFTQWVLSGNAPAGTYAVPYSVQAIFAVDSGSTTFYLRGNSDGANYSVDMNRLSLVYLPTAYGFVSNNAKPRGGDDPAEATVGGEAEREATEALLIEQLQQEMAAQRARMAKLSSQVEELQEAVASTAAE